MDTAITLTFLAPPVIIAGLSFLLSHIFDDSDIHRGICAQLRAKYLLTNIGPINYITSCVNPSEPNLSLPKILEDFLIFRSLKIHFGIICFLILFGIALLIAILLTTIYFMCSTMDSMNPLQLRVAYFIIFSFIGLAIICFVLQITYTSQGKAISRRIKELDTHKYSNKKTFVEQCDEIIEAQGTSRDYWPGELKNHYIMISRGAIWIHLKYCPLLVCIFSDLIITLIFFIPIVKA